MMKDFEESFDAAVVFFFLVFFLFLHLTLPLPYLPLLFYASARGGMS